MMGRIGFGLGLLGFQALVALVLIWGLKLQGRPVTWTVIAFAVFNLGLPYLMWLQAGARQPSFWLAALVARPVFAWYFNWLCFLIFLAPVIVLGRGLAWVSGWNAVIAGLRWLTLGLAGIWGVATVVGLIGGIFPPRVVTREIRLPHLPKEENGIRVAQLTDPHVAWWNSREEICRIGAIIADLKPDLLLLTGDMVDHNPDYVFAMTDCLPAQPPRLGRYAIIGNHDVYTGKEAVALRMEKRGYTMLRNRWISLEDQGSKLVLAGFDDSGQGWTGYDQALKMVAQIFSDVPKGRPLILLAHRPPRLKDLAAFPVDLILSGHTHGGQIRLPFGGPGLADISFATPAGLYREGRQTLYVSSGTGTVGWPFRLFCPPEITLITLVAGEE